MVVKVVDALVAEFAVHRVLRHGHVADPAVLHGFVRRHGPGLPLRIGGFVETYIPLVASGAFVLLLHQRDGILLVFLPVPTQMHVDGIHQQGLHAKVDHQGHGAEPDQGDGRGRAFGQDRGNDQQPFQTGKYQTQKGGNLGIGVGTREAVVASGWCCWWCRRVERRIGHAAVLSSNAENVCCVLMLLLLLIVCFCLL